MIFSVEPEEVEAVEEHAGYAESSIAGEY